MSRNLIDTPDGPMTRKEAAARYGMHYRTLLRRIWEKWPPEKWFIPPMRPVSDKPRPKKPYGFYWSPWGLLSLYEIADRIGMRPRGLRQRLYGMQWSQEHAFNTPLRGRPGKDFIFPPDEYRRRVAEQKAKRNEKVTGS